MDELIIFGKRGILGCAYMQQYMNPEEITEYIIQEYIKNKEEK